MLGGAGFIIAVCLLGVIGGARDAIAQVVPPTVEPGRLQRDIQRDKIERPKLEGRTLLVEPEAPQGQAVDGPQFVLGSLVFEGVSVYSEAELRPYYSDYVGRRIGIGDLDTITQAIQARYRNDGYIITRVVVAAQTRALDVENAVITVRVVEAYVDKVVYGLDIEELGAGGRVKRILDKIARSCRPGDTPPAGRPCPLHQQVLERYLLLANDLAGVTISAVLTRAEVSGAANLAVSVLKDRGEAFVALDNRGNRFIGSLLAESEITGNNLLGVNDRLRLTGNVSLNFDELKAFSVSEQVPIGSEGTTLTVLGSYLESQPSGLPQRIDSKSWQTALILTHPFIRTRARNLFVALTFNYVNSQLDIEGVREFEDIQSIIRLRGIYDFTDASGINLIALEVNRGFKILGAAEQGDALSRERADGSFTSLYAEASRLQRITNRISLLLTVKGQYSFDNLLSSEEFAIGGDSFGRGFDMSELTGDHGVGGMAELQFGFELGGSRPIEFQLYGFVDAGKIWHKDGALTLSLDDDLSEDLVSAGGGLRFNFTDHFSGYVEASKPLSRVVASEGNKDPRVFFGLSLRF